MARAKAKREEANHDGLSRKTKVQSPSATGLASHGEWVLFRDSVELVTLSPNEGRSGASDHAVQTVLPHL